jgi:CHAT domain-containing protein/predicted negative regulator of RcsB-dependent stress response
MRRISTPRRQLLFVVLCLALVVRAQETTNPIETARQLSSAANDTGITLPERKDALQKLETSAQLFLSAGEKLEAARVLNRVGRLQLILGSTSDSISAHNQALSLLKETPSVEVEVDNLNGLAAAYLRNLNKRDAEQALHRSIWLSDQEHYTPGKAQALLTLSNLQSYENHGVAVRTALESLALWTTIGDKPAIARTHEQMGDYYLAQHLLAEATQSYEQALQIWRDLNNSPGQAAALINLGYIDLRRAEWQSGMSRFGQAGALIDAQSEPQMMGQISCGMAELYNAHNMAEEGLIYYEQALNYYQQSQNTYLIWYATCHLGWTYYLQQNYPEALSKLQQSLTYLKDEEIAKAMTREYMGRVYLETGDYPAALQAFQFALGVFTQTGNPMEAARVQALTASALERQGQLASARRNYQKALEFAERVSDRVSAATIYHALGRVELKSGNQQKAEAYLLRSIDITEKLHGVSTIRDLRTAFYGSVHDRYQTYIEYLMTKARTSPGNGYDVRAFETSESAKARSLAEFFRATQANVAPGIDSELAKEESSLRQLLAQKAEYRTKLLTGRVPGSKEVLNEVNADFSRLETKYNDLIATINQRFPAYKQMMEPANSSLRRIQDEVIQNDQTLLLEYSLGLEKSYAWAVTRNSIKVVELPGREEINDAAKKLSGLLVLPPAPDSESKLNQAAQDLSRMILAPLAADLNKQVIIVVADGGLNYVPFQILPQPSNNEPLVADFEIINAPSASVLGDLRREAAQRRPATRLLAAFGDPVFNQTQIAQNSTSTAVGMVRWRSAMRDIRPDRHSFDSSMIPQLFYAARELANLRELGGSDALVLSDVSATRDSLLKTDLAQYAMLHLATHGIFDPDRPEDSGLLLSTTNSDGQQIDGFLRLQDIYELRAPVELVVLSACETALGRDVQGEGLVGVTRGFMYAGASSVIASLWKVDDAATAELMKIFYTNMLQHGMTPGEALRAAQNSIRQDPNWRSPYYWAAFTLQGEYSQVIKPVTTPKTTFVRLRWIIVIGVVLFMLVGFALYRRHRTYTKST